MKLLENLTQYEIILASQSPRRIQFLKHLGLNFTVQPTQVNEDFDEKLMGSQITDYLCKKKADAFLFTKENQLIITCDTIVWNENQALNKPNTFEEAHHMISSLSEKTHEVISSLCIKTPQKTEIVNDKTLVTFSKLTSEEISYYIHNFQPYDKAGAYGIQEWIGLIGIQKIEGSYTNVVGMPMEKLYQTLKKF